MNDNERDEIKRIVTNVGGQLYGRKGVKNQIE